MHYLKAVTITFAGVFLLLTANYCSSKGKGKDVDDDDSRFFQDKIVQWVKIVHSSLTGPFKSWRYKKYNTTRFMQGLSRQLDEWAKDAIVEETEEHEIRDEFWKEMDAKIVTLINSHQRQGIFPEELCDELRRACELLKTDIYDRVQKLKKMIAENSPSTFVKAGKTTPAFEKIVTEWKDLLMAGVKFVLTDDHQFYTLAGLLIAQWLTSAMKQFGEHPHAAGTWRESFWKNFEPQMTKYFDPSIRPDEEKNGILMKGVMKSLDALIAGKRDPEMSEIFDGFWINIDEKFVPPLDKKGGYVAKSASSSKGASKGDTKGGAGKVSSPKKNVDGGQKKGEDKDEL